MISLKTHGDRTLFFDFLPIELENVGGFKTRFQIYTVPGQVYYNSTRKAVLTGVDGVIFVADSQASMEQENLESFNNLIENLKYYNRDISQIPLILQYNKRDLNDVMSVEDLDRLFNQPQRLSFSASAVTGNGVLQTLTACCKQVLQDLKNKSKRTEQGATNKPEIQPPIQPQPTIEHSPAISPTVPTDSESSIETTVHDGIATNEIKAGTIPGPPAADLHSDQAAEGDTDSSKTDKLPPFAFPGTPARNLTKSQQPGVTSEPFIPEITQAGKPRIVNPHTIILPIRLATDPDQQNMLNIDITLTIKDFCKTI
jgi:signal recognition particle receptor subunit beta